jgi:DNA-binding CsgD family transcriptional regulator
VAIDRLRRSDSPRLEGEDLRHIEVLAQSDRLPPILVHQKTMRVIDGMHRLRAAELRGQTSIEVRFFDGDQETTFIEAVRANREHGLPLTLADRQSAAMRIIGYRPHMSDRTIADITGLAPRTVAAIRGRVDPEGGPAVRVGKDGRARPLNSAAGRRIASDTIAKRPDAPLREIARVAGISLGTARDVRERMRRGDDPVPPMMRHNEGLSAGPHRGGERRGPKEIRSGAERRVPEVGGSPAKRDQDVLMRNLSSDPSLRFSEAGRATLRWLFARINRMDGWEDVVDALPSHCGYVVAEIARNCGQEWLAFAAAVERRLKSTA